MIERKTLYLLTAAVFMAIIAVPSVYFVDAVRTYFGFLDNWSSGVIKPSKPSALPPPRAQAPQKARPPEVKFVKFSIKRPKAKDVRVAADFNGWQADALVLKKGENGVWEAVVPLPKGNYHYFFKVDGETVLDPSAAQTAELNGKKVSVIKVK